MLKHQVLNNLTYRAAGGLINEVDTAVLVAIVVESGIR